MEVANAGALVAHIIDRPDGVGGRPRPRAEPAAPDPGLAQRRVACIAHFIEPEDLLHWDPTLAPLTHDQCMELLERTRTVIDPFLGAEVVVGNACGRSVRLAVVCLPMAARHLHDRVQRGQGPAVHAEIEVAIGLAKKWGAELVGFAGFTSIVTNNCMSLADDHMGFTSGNSLTAASAIMAMDQEIARLEIDRGEAHIAVVGAAGNIGQVLTEVGSARFGTLTLLGHPGHQARLHRLAERICLMRPGVNVRTSADIADLASCDVILSATNSPFPLIRSAHLSARPRLICDIAVPGDVHSEVRRDFPALIVLKGGIVTMPAGQDISIPGMPLDRGDVYACVSEVLLLGLAGHRGHYSYGALRADRVRHIQRLAAEHGFAVRPKT